MFQISFIFSDILITFREIKAERLRGNLWRSRRVIKQVFSHKLPMNSNVFRGLIFSISHSIAAEVNVVEWAVKVQLAGD